MGCSKGATVIPEATPSIYGELLKDRPVLWATVVVSCSWFRAPVIGWPSELKLLTGRVSIRKRGDHRKPLQSFLLRTRVGLPSHRFLASLFVLSSLDRRQKCTSGSPLHEYGADLVKLEIPHVGYAFSRMVFYLEPPAVYHYSDDDDDRANVQICVPDLCQGTPMGVWPLPVHLHMCLSA